VGHDFSFSNSNDQVCTRLVGFLPQKWKLDAAPGGVALAAARRDPNHSGQELAEEGW
jgi:hypothetical protein